MSDVPLLPPSETLSPPDYHSTITDPELASVFCCFPFIPYLRTVADLHLLSPCDRGPILDFLYRAGFWETKSPNP